MSCKDLFSAASSLSSFLEKQSQIYCRSKVYCITKQQEGKHFLTQPFFILFGFYSIRGKKRAKIWRSGPGPGSFLHCSPEGSSVEPGDHLNGTNMARAARCGVTPGESLHRGRPHGSISNGDEGSTMRHSPGCLGLRWAACCSHGRQIGSLCPPTRGVSLPPFGQCFVT